LHLGNVDMEVANRVSGKLLFLRFVSFDLRQSADAVPTLRPGDIVSLDNLGSHKSKAVRDAIRAAGAKRIFLPAYSPDLNPIEQVFAKLKHLMRKAGERTIDATWNRLGTSLDHFSRQECANYFSNAGYASW
jgi:transposase